MVLDVGLSEAAPHINEYCSADGILSACIRMRRHWPFLNSWTNVISLLALFYLQDVGSVDPEHKKLY